MSTNNERLIQIAKEHGFKAYPTGEKYVKGYTKGITVEIPFVKTFDDGTTIRGSEGFENITTLRQLREVLGY